MPRGERCRPGDRIMDELFSMFPSPSSWPLQSRVCSHGSCPSHPVTPAVTCRPYPTRCPHPSATLSHCPLLSSCLSHLYNHCCCCFSGLELSPCHWCHLFQPTHSNQKKKPFPESQSRVLQSQLPQLPQDIWNMSSSSGQWGCWRAVSLQSPLVTY